MLPFSFKHHRSHLQGRMMSENYYISKVKDRLFEDGLLSAIYCFTLEPTDGLPCFSFNSSYLKRPDNEF